MKQIFAKKSLTLILILLSCYISFAQAGDGKSLQKVIIIRHGEKPDEGDNLSCQGFNRAFQLADVLYAKV